MRNRFDRQLTELNQDMIQMGHMIGQAIGMAISALNNRDKEQAEKVIDYDDEINEEERIIEKSLLETFAAAAACGKGSARNFIGTENDYRHGKNW